MMLRPPCRSANRHATRLPRSPRLMACTNLTHTGTPGIRGRRGDQRWVPEWDYPIGQRADIDRSAFGVSATRAEVYAGGPALSVCTLGRVLRAAERGLRHGVGYQPGLGDRCLLRSLGKRCARFPVVPDRARSSHALIGCPPAVTGTAGAHADGKYQGRPGIRPTCPIPSRPGWAARCPLPPGSGATCARRRPTAIPSTSRCEHAKPA